MSIEVGDDDVDLCYAYHSTVKTNVAAVEVSKCYRARILATAAILPGYADFSSFQSIAYANPNAVITEEQMKYLIEDAIVSDPDLFPKMTKSDINLMY